MRRVLHGAAILALSAQAAAFLAPSSLVSFHRQSSAHSLAPAPPASARLPLRTVPRPGSAVGRACAAKASTVVEQGDFVSIAYKGLLDDGTVFDSTEGRDSRAEGQAPYFEIEVGGGLLLPGIEKEVLGIAVGEERKFRLPANEAYGEYSDKLKISVPLANLGPSASQAKAGMQVRLTTGEVATITEVTDTELTLDGNHPLAGKALNFEVKCLEILAKAADVEVATFAGGCFWGLELAYQRVPGVLATSVGYTQGETESPSYEEVCSGTTGHTEAVQVKFNPAAVSFKALLDVFFGRVDVTALNRQGNDAGTQYRNGIYFHTPEQEAAVRAEIAARQPALDAPIVTEVLANATYFRAEEYHQQYLEKGGQDASKGASETIRCYG